MRAFAYVSSLDHARVDGGTWQKLERIKSIEFLRELIFESCTNGDANE